MRAGNVAWLKIPEGSSIMFYWKAGHDAVRAPRKKTIRSCGKGIRRTEMEVYMEIGRKKGTGNPVLSLFRRFGNLGITPVVAVVAVDDDGWISFNGRPCSRDRMVMEELSEVVTDGVGVFFVNFNGAAEAATRLLRAGCGGIFYVESVDPVRFVGWYDAVVVYRWNTRYPGDVRCTVNTGAYVHAGTEDFAGHSHERITREIYLNKKWEGKVQEW